jgi:hypothetical protein
VKYAVMTDKPYMRVIGKDGAGEKSSHLRTTEHAVLSAQKGISYGEQHA